MNYLEKRTVLLNAVFNLSSTFSTLFLNVYLFVYAKSLPLMCVYTIIRISLFPLFFIIGSKIIRKHSYTLTFSLGLILIAGSLLYALLATSLFDINPNYVLIAAVLTGIGEGLYWFSSNACNQLVSNIESRANFLAYTGIFNNIASLAAPVIASLIIKNSASDMDAYRIILIIIFVLYVIVAFISLSIRITTKGEDIELKESFSFKDKMWNDHSLAVVLYGLRNSLGLVLTGLLVYNAAGDGGVYSKLQSLFAVITIVFFFVLTRALNKEHIKTTFIIGVIIAVLSMSVLVLFDNIYGAIFFGITNAICTCFYDNSYNYFSANIISHYMHDMVGRVVARETFLSLGRCIGMGIIVLFYFILPEDLYLKVSVIGLSLTSIFVYKLLIKYKKN